MATRLPDNSRIATERASTNTVIMKLSSIELTNYDIETFSPGRDFSINVVDAYFTVLRGRIGSDMLKVPDAERVLLLNYKLASAIFDQRASDAVCSRRNVFLFE